MSRWAVRLHLPPPCMNAFGYFLHRFGSRLGLSSERHRWTAINRETQILSEAEDLLGARF